MTKEEIIKCIVDVIGDAQVELVDTRGSGDHFSAVVTSSMFKDKSLIKQHRMVMDCLKEVMKGPNAPLHAFDLKTKIK